MKKLSLLILALVSTGMLFSQTPVNDDCAGLISLGKAPVCTPTVYSNVNATASNIGVDNAPSCFQNTTATHDVWFEFICPDTLFDFRITLTGVGNSITNPQFAIYRGDCVTDGLFEYLCAKAGDGETELFLDVIGLTPGLPYYIRVSDYSLNANPNWGEFTLCVDKIPPIVTIDQGSSSLCKGTLYDDGGPDGDYTANKDYTFVICPNQPSECLTFTMEYFNIEEFFGTDLLSFYDGNTTSAPLITQINGGNFGEPEGGGGVCFEIQATSGCLTVAFHSDNTQEFEGWKANWECSSVPCKPQPELSVNTNVTNNDIVKAVSTPLTTVTITNIDCSDGAYGTFSFATDDNALGLEKGLVLTSGDAQLSIGPNSATNSGFQIGSPGDADLDILSGPNGSPSLDACVVELDVFANTNELVFEYVFGSDEYPEFANSVYNDIFAFLISGPGIAGDPGLNGAKNIAVLPFSTTPVEINNVNNLDNWQYYRNNEGDQTFAQVLEYDGLTSDTLGVKKSLTARSAVIPCNTYHLKLAVADRFDRQYDSGVFISEIKAGGPKLGVQFAGNIPYLTENCLPGVPNVLTISIPKALNINTVYTVTLSGSATQGLDYLLNIPAVITIPAGQTQLSFPIATIPDALAEGTETITIQLSNDFGCGSVLLATVDIPLVDQAHIEINAGNDTLFLCAGATLQLEASGADQYFWTPPAAVSNAFIPNPTTSPTQSFWVSVSGTLGVCTDMDSAFVQIIAPTIDVSAPGGTAVCQGTPVSLQSVNNVNNTGLVWSPASGLNDQYISNPTALPGKTTTYKATVTIAGCSASDEVTILVDTLFFPGLIGDTIVCQNYPVQLANVIEGSSTTYQWTPAAGLSDPTSSGPIALPDVTTTYILTATSANGACVRMDTVKVSIVPADVDILGKDTIEICLGQSVPLAAEADPTGTNPIQWSPSFYLSNTTGTNTTATPDESITVLATYSVNGCTVRDSVRLRVDSLPDQSLMRVQDKSIYCPGDTVYLISPTYEPANFPDIQIEWLPFGGQETPVDNWNMVITATLTHVFQRAITNRGCVDTSEIEVPVGVPPTLNIVATPQDICPGGSAQIQVTVDPPGTKLEWQDMPPTLSCGECPNPTATPGSTTTYTVTTPDADCPNSAGITINVLPLPLFGLPLNPVICPTGPGVQLNTVTEPGVTYTWTPATGLDDPFSATPVARPNATTTYTVVADGQVCDGQATVTVTVASATIELGQDQTICAGTGATLNAAVTGTPGTVTWQPGGLSGNTVTVNPDTTTTYTATLQYGNNCIDDDAVKVTVVPGVTLTNLIALPDSLDYVCIGSPITLEVTVAPPTATLVWNQNGSPLSGITGDSVTFIPVVEEGLATFTVTATGANNCTTTSSEASFNFVRCIAVPNAFTPNDDGVNDTFGPLLFNTNTEVTTFYIFNRWGTKVFEASADKPRWDGKSDGKDAASDVYAYYIELRYADGRQETLKGDVALLR